MAESLTQVDIGDGSGGLLRGCKAGETDVTKCIPLNQIGTKELFESYITTFLHGTLWEHTFVLRITILKGIWGDPKHKCQMSLGKGAGGKDQTGALTGAGAVIKKFFGFGAGRRLLDAGGKDASGASAAKGGLGAMIKALFKQFTGEPGCGLYHFITKIENMLAGALESMGGVAFYLGRALRGVFFPAQNSDGEGG